LASDLELEISKSRIESQKSKNRLSGFDDLACFQTARAHPKALRAAADQSPDGLQVWIEAAVCAVIGVTYAVTKLRPLAADLTAFRHCYVPPMRISV
jgi:hypothetical protein